MSAESDGPTNGGLRRTETGREAQPSSTGLAAAGRAVARASASASRTSPAYVATDAGANAAASRSSSLARRAKSPSVAPCAA